MSIYHKISFVIIFIITSIFAFQCPTNKECYCQIWKNFLWDAHIHCKINNTFLNIYIEQNESITIQCLNSTNLSDFNLYMTLGTYNKINFEFCNMPNNFKLMDIVQKLGVIEISIDMLFLALSKNLTLKKHHIEGFKNLKLLSIWGSNVFHMDKDLLADLKKLTSVALYKNNLQHLETEFFDYAPQLVTLFLEKNNLKSIKPNTFDKLKNLKGLNLVQNNLTELHMGIFDKLVALQNLYISSNNIVTLPKDVFAKLKNLSDLRLNQNSFIDLPRNLLQRNTKLVYIHLSHNQENLILSNGFFSNLTNLKLVNLTNNGLVTLPEDLFWGSSLLKTINLNNNYLKFLDVNIFQNLTELRTLRLNSNNLQDLPDNIFLSAHRLEILDLSNNRITSISEQLLNKLYSLEELSIKENYLKIIHNDSFKSLKKLNILNLSDNHLESLPDNIFSDNKQLKILNLSNNRITVTFEQLFRRLYLLEELSMKNNYLKTIPEGSFRFLEKLKIADLSTNRLNILPDFIFSNTKQLKILNLSNNRITAISKNLFDGLLWLEELNMEQNHLKTISDKNFNDLHNVKIIKLSYNNLKISKDDKQFGYYHSPFHLPKLKELYLTNNNISIIFSVSSNLHILDLSYNNISSIKTEDLLFTSNDIIVNLTHNKIQHINLHDNDLHNYIRDYLHNDIDIKYITEVSETDRNVKILIDHNPLRCDCDVLYDLLRYNEGKMHNARSYFQIELRNSVCYRPKEMQKVRISSLYSRNLICRIRNTDSITVCPKKCDCFLRPQNKAFILDCSNKNLTSVPDDIKKPNISLIRAFTKTIDSIFQFELNFSHNFLMDMPNLRTMEIGNESVKKLILSHNIISEISLDGLLTTMKVLELHNNSLSRIHSNVLRFWKNINLTHLTLHENPWNCDCDAEELFNFIHTNSEILLPEVSKVLCYDKKKSISEMTFNDFCPLDTTVIISASAAIATAIALIGLIFGLYYKYQKHIKIWLFAHQWCLWFVTEKELDKDKLYDAFVSYSHKDDEFVENELVPKLESRPTPFKLCLHYRDWLAGEFISDNITRSVKNSRRTIVVLSPNFLESVWGRMEFRTAHCQALNEGRARVIIILYGDIKPTDDMDPDLKAYISMNTYIQWGDPWFWNKLRYALPHQSKQPKRSSGQRVIFENYEL